MGEIPVTLSVNGTEHELVVPARLSLADLLRERLRLTGTHLGCEHGVCGVCTVLVDGSAARACLLLAVQVDGCEVRTVEDLDDDGALSPLQEAFDEERALQCGFCTPGFLLLAEDHLRRSADPEESAVREQLASNLCRCTGYAGLVRAVRRAAACGTQPGCDVSRRGQSLGS